jgi:hypothetical protein
MVLDQATWLKNTPFGIHQQFPKPIEDKRRKLYPVLKDAKRQGKNAVLVRDKLFINGSQYFVDDGTKILRLSVSVYRCISSRNDEHFQSQCCVRFLVSQIYMCVALSSVGCSAKFEKMRLFSMERHCKSITDS